MNCSKEQLKLYAVTDSTWLNGRSLDSVVETAILGGATFVQLREKHLTDEALLILARNIKAVTDQYHVPFVINDRVQVALAVDADGVHVGQDDMNAAEARRLIGPNKILGVSADTLEQAILAEQQGADYLGVAVFATSTKTDAVTVPLETLKAITAAVSIPVVAIGGIKAHNIQKLRYTNIAGIAVVSALFAADDIYASAKLLRQRVEGYLY